MRGIYQRDAGGRTWAPADAKAGLDHEYLSPLAKEGSLFLLAGESPGAAAAILKKCAAFQPSASCLQKLAERAGQMIEANEDGLYDAIRANESAPAGTRALAVSLDGANVLLNEPGEKKGRPRERPGKDDAEESPSAYRNAMVGSATFYGTVPKGEKSPRKLSGRVVARMPEEGYPHFKRCFEREVAAAAGKLPPEAELVLLCDGARGLWKYAGQTKLFKDFVKVLDYFHAAEHLSLAAEAVFGKSSAAGEKWHEVWRKRLLEEKGAAGKLLRALDYLARTRKLGKAARHSLAAQRGYFKRNRKLMEYAELREAGLPIGSGPVEAACKVVVKQRLCRSGQRWSRVGGQHILHLRALVRSGRWESFWPRYRNLEQVAKSAA